MPLIAWAVAAYAAGLLLGFAPLSLATACAAATAVVVASAIVARLGVRSGVGLAFVAGIGLFVARDAAVRDSRCLSARPVAAGSTRGVPVCLGPRREELGVLERWRQATALRLDTLFASDAPLARALLIADMTTVPVDVRERFAASGLVHVLSISGLHVAIVAGAVLLLFDALRFGRLRARWAACAVTVWYVLAIGAPPPAVRSGAMLAAVTLSRSLQRPLSPWAALALGAVVPLIDPRVVLDLGWQLSVAGFAALTAAQAWTRRMLPREWRGWRRTIVTDLVVSTLATCATAPLVAWAFGRLSLVAPLTNLAAGPVVAALQPALFLSMLLAQWCGAASDVAALAADATRPLLQALMAVADVGARVPGGTMIVAPSLAVAVCCGIAGAAVIAAAASRRAAPALVCAITALAAAAWWPPQVATGMAELHVIDVGQGDALAFRTPAGRWLLFDAGRVWRGGDAGRTTVMPYLRRRGGELVFFSLSHPHADHVGGATSVLQSLHPSVYYDAAFAGGSAPYRASLATAQRLGIAWRRVHPGDSTVVDGVVITFLAPDSTWTASLKDPNLASAVVMVRYGRVKFLLTGDAEAAEETRLLEQWDGQLVADVLKVAHHGSRTSSTPDFLSRVHPRVALISVGADNMYRHPDADVLHALQNIGANIFRTDQLGNIILRTDGIVLCMVVGAHQWWVP